MSVFNGFSIDTPLIPNHFFGFSIEVEYPLIVNVVDSNDAPISSAIVEIYMDGQILKNHQTNMNGIAFIPLPIAGDYEISTTTSDRRQTVTWDGVNAVKVDFIVYGIQHQYRIKAKGAGAVGDSEWSEILTKNI